MTLWLALTIMGILAVLFVAWPLYNRSKKFTLVLAASIIAVAALSVGLYGKLGSPDIPSGTAGGSVTHMTDTVAALATRLESEPGDVNGWKMLGRSNMSLGDYVAAVAAFEKAVELESSNNAQTLVDLGTAMLADGNTQVTGRVASLFESALALEPNNPQALFYGGVAAINRADKELAASRWEMLLGLNPPPEIQEVLRQRVAEWRGQPLVASEPMAPEVTREQGDAVVRAEVSVSDAAMAALPADATVFIIARDPAQPSPPIAVVRRRVADLPTVIELGDSNSMVAGRSLSGFADFELIARVSVSGRPAQQPGDWIGTVIVKPADNNSVSLLIDTEIR